MPKLKIHPSFWLYALIMVISSDYVYFIASLFAVMLHEFAHAKVAYSCGYYLNQINLTPFGAMLQGGEKIKDSDGIKIAVAGPLSNFCCCILLLALWWLIPSSYSYTKVIYKANLVIGAFNLLPIFPLDGARVLIAVANKPLKLLKALRIVGILSSTLIFIGFLASFFVQVNYSLGIMATIIYLSSVGGTEKETYRLIANAIPYSKSFDAPIKKSTVMVHLDLKLIRLLRHIKPDTDTIFEVVDDNLKVITALNEQAVRELALRYSPQATIKELLSLYFDDKPN